MVRISPFHALRPRPDKASDIISVPYDVVNRQEALELAEGKPDSFLRVVRSELEFPPESNPYADQVYDRARDNLRRLEKEGLLFTEEQACLYVYRLNVDGHQQTGLVARAHADDYKNDLIKKHELTRKEKEADRTRHVDHLGANTGPVFLLYRSVEVSGLTAELDRIADTTRPLYDLTREDGVRHRIYKVEPGETLAALVEKFARLKALYIADGHHRAASAANVCALRRERAGLSGAEEGDFDWFLSVSFPDEQLKVLPYNRAVKDISGMATADLMAGLKTNFDFLPDAGGELLPRQFRMYFEGTWHKLQAKPETYEQADLTGSLDVTILQNHVFSAMFGITDPRTSDRLTFVGGIRGEKELERLVNSGDYKIAFSLYPTSTAELLSIADAGEIMPPKSTWFEPKLCSGFLTNKIADR